MRHIILIVLGMMADDVQYMLYLCYGSAVHVMLDGIWLCVRASVCVCVYKGTVCLVAECVFCGQGVML